MDIDAATAPLLVLPDAPFYVALAIFVAITAIVSVDIREGSRLLPKGVVNRVALLLLTGSWITIINIIFVMMVLNDFNSLSNSGAWSMIFHTIALVILLIVITTWYVCAAIFKSTVPGVPTNAPYNP